MSPAEAEVRRFLSFAGFVMDDRMTLPIAHAQSLISELDALRAAIVRADLQLGDGHIEAARKTLDEAMDSDLKGAGRE